MLTIYIITSLILLSIIISGLFFYISSKENEKLIMYWSISWILYSAALTCLLIAVTGEHMQFMEIKKIFDMYSIQALLVGVYKFCHVKMPDYWIRFGIYLTIWLGISIYLDLDFFSISIPVFIFDMTMVGVICYIIFRYWPQINKEKIFYCIVFILWGGIKGYLAIYEFNYSGSPIIYMGEVLYITILNVCILMIYVRHMRQEMIKTKEHLELIVENVTDAIFYYRFKPVPSFVYVTPSIEQLTGYGPRVLYNSPRAILEMVDKDDFEVINKLFFSGPYDQALETEVIRIVKKDGTKIWAGMNISTIKAEETVIAIEGVIRDITEMKKVEEDLVTSKKSRDLMLSYISHELKTPITSIVGYATAIKDGTINNEEEQRNAMDIISSKAIILERMIMDLAQLSQLETNQYSFIYEHIECERLADYILENILPELKESGIQYKFIKEHEMLDDLHVIADAARINQVVTNLVTNAIKYTRAKNRIIIKFTTDAKKRNMIISVSDSGMGIAEEDIPYIFDKFFKSGNSKAIKDHGRGLGLAISKEIVESHGGIIEVNSKYGKGSTFRVNIPIYE